LAIFGPFLGLLLAITRAGSIALRSCVTRRCAMFVPPFHIVRARSTQTGWPKTAFFCFFRVRVLNVNLPYIQQRTGVRGGFGGVSPPVENFFGPSGLECGFAAIGIQVLAIFLAQIFRRAIGIRTCFSRAWNVRRPSAWWRPLSSHATGPLASCNLGCCASRTFILLRLSCRAVAVVSNMCGCKADLGRGNICRQMLLTKPTFPSFVKNICRHAFRNNRF
jgi:hypothetical protein